MSTKCQQDVNKMSTKSQKNSMKNCFVDRVHRSGLSMSFFLLCHAFRQILILDKTFMLLMSANICPMSPHVPTCPHMSPHVPKCPKCPQMSPNVTKCPQMSLNIRKMSRKCQHNVNKKSTKGQQKSQQKVSCRIRKPKSLILHEKLGKSYTE